MNIIAELSDQTAIPDTEWKKKIRNRMRNLTFSIENKNIPSNNQLPEKTYLIACTNS